MIFLNKGENKISVFVNFFVFSNMKSVCKETKQDIACPVLFGGSAGCWYGPTLPLGKRKEDFNSIAIVNLFPQSALELCKNLAMHGGPVVQGGQWTRSGAQYNFCVHRSNDRNVSGTGENLEASWK